MEGTDGNGGLDRWRLSAVAGGLDRQLHLKGLDAEAEGNSAELM